MLILVDHLGEIRIVHCDVFFSSCKKNTSQEYGMILQYEITNDCVSEKLHL